jgi:hypothetical protein
MERSTKAMATSLLTLALVAFAGCDAGEHPPVIVDSGEAVADPDFDESQLPPDFPLELLPPTYAVGTFAELGGVASISFENNVPVEQTIFHYAALLGEPTLDADTTDGGRTVQWHDAGPWHLSVIGDGNESIIGFARPPL